MTDIPSGVPDLIDPEPPIIMAKGQRSTIMGVKRPIKESVQQKYAQELANSEHMADIGFNKKKKGAAQINEKVYGSTQPGSVSPIEEMKAFKNFGLSDGTYIKDLEAQKEKDMNPNDKIDAAMAAVKAEKPQEAPQETPQAAPPVTDAQVPVEASGPSDDLSDDPEKRLAQVAEQLSKQFPNAPSLEALKQWKGMHGEIFLLPIDDKVYIYRYLKRQEWAQMQANPALQEMRPDQQEDLMFTKCLLWPPMQPQNMAALPAGAVTMIVEQIRMQSLFLDPVQVANLTLKL